ncbi:MAG TPA: hypothetical protein VFH32_06975, partial [Rubrobacteraceae bacterium]|nr:hypothetical protein [Rubrobacteraceae bacterium]
MDENERLRRWRLVLGGDSEETIGTGLAVEDRGMDGVLAALYGGEKDSKNVGHEGSLPNVTRWLGDIRTYFPSPVVRVMQKDALDRLGLERMLLEPEMLEAVEPDVHL